MPNIVDTFGEVNKMAVPIEKITRSKRNTRIAIFFTLTLIIGFGILLIDLNQTKFRANCVRCYFCVERCPVGAISLDEHGYPVINKSKCLAFVRERNEFQWERCGLCLRGCPTRIIEILNDENERRFHTTE